MSEVFQKDWRLIPMSSAQASTSPHLYPQSLQLKLYQGFIFSVPILFSIILFLLFYMFYLKRRAPTVSSPQPTLPRSLHESPIASSCEMGLKGNLSDKLPIILFDEDLRMRNSMCCVCLGEFEMKEELHQIPTCRHVFHVDCIRHWICSTPTCPLCRCFIVPISASHGLSQSPLGPNQNPEQLQEQQQIVRENPDEANDLREDHMVIMEGSSSGSTSTLCGE